MLFCILIQSIIERLKQANRLFQPFLFLFKMKKIVIFSFLVFLFCVQNVFGQSTSDSLSVTLSEVDVNARRNQIYTGAGRVVTVVEREAIKQMPVQSVDELLESVAGIDIRQRGVGGTQSDISIRGGSFDQVLVLLNGVNITDPQTGHYNLDVPVELSAYRDWETK